MGADCFAHCCVPQPRTVSASTPWCLWINRESVRDDWNIICIPLLLPPKNYKHFKVTYCLSFTSEMWGNYSYEWLRTFYIIISHRQKFLWISICICINNRIPDLIVEHSSTFVEWMALVYTDKQVCCTNTGWIGSQVFIISDRSQ